MDATPEQTAAELAHVSARADALFAEHMASARRRADRIFAFLLPGEILGAVAVAVMATPRAWAPLAASHPYGALACGAGLGVVAAGRAAIAPGGAGNRALVATAQIGLAATSLHLLHGRAEGHLVMLASFAFLSLYRDWRVLAWATLLALTAYFVGAARWPESAFGTASPAPWLVWAHAGGVAVFDAIFVAACLDAVAELRSIAERSAEVDWQCRLFAEIDHRKTEDLARAMRELEEEQEARGRNEKLAAVGQLAATVGHELRNPLAAVRNAATYVRKRVVDPKYASQPPSADPKVAQFLDLMLRELDVSTTIISDLLDFARERRPAFLPCPLRPLVDEAIEVVPKSHVRVTNEVPQSLPSPNIDHDQFRQVLVNLIQNAVEAAGSRPDGSVEVRAEGGEDEEPWKILVVDNGPGMSKEILAKVFQPLYTTKAKGTGLGLAVVANMVKAHKGTISAKSEEGKGSRFTIVLPHNPVRSAESVARLPMHSLPGEIDDPD
jgi:signal transduction histidine kinase